MGRHSLTVMGVRSWMSMELLALALHLLLQLDDAFHGLWPGFEEDHDLGYLREAAACSPTAGPSGCCRRSCRYGLEHEKDDARVRRKCISRPTAADRACCGQWRPGGLDPAPALQYRSKGRTLRRGAPCGKVVPYSWEARLRLVRLPGHGEPAGRRGGRIVSTP